MPLKVFLLTALFLTSCSFHGLELYQRRDHQEYKYGKYGMSGDFYMPSGSGPHPAVLLIHGGSWAGGKRSHMAWIARRLVKEGFAVFNISYRMVPEYTYPAQLDDCKEAVRWLRLNAAELKINPEKIAVFGYSAGAQLAALTGTLQTDSDSKVQAVVAGSGPHNLLYSSDNKAVIRFLGVTYDKHPETFREASPLFNVSSDDPPMFIYHGTYDQTVALKHSKDLHEALNAFGIRNELYLVDGYGHISLFILGNSPIDKAAGFLKSVLK